MTGGASIKTAILGGELFFLLSIGDQLGRNVRDPSDAPDGDLLRRIT